MIKMTYVVRRRPDIPEEEFHRYWWEHHGPLVASVKDALRIRRYVQVHTIVDAGHRPGGMQPAHDGVAELWWDSRAELEAAAASEEGQRAGALLVEDEARMVDFSRSSIALGEERVVIE